MSQKHIFIATELGLLWLIITFFNLFGWVKEGFSGGYGMLGYILYGAAVPIVAGVIAAVVPRPEARGRSVAEAFFVAAGILVLGFLGMYLRNQMKVSTEVQQEPMYDAAFEQERAKADAYRQSQQLQK